MKNTNAKYLTVRISNREYRVQFDASGVGHNWRDVPAGDTLGGCLGEVEAWISEEKPSSGATYTASNGITYRTV